MARGAGSHPDLCRCVQRLKASYHARYALPKTHIEDIMSFNSQIREGKRLVALRDEHRADIPLTLYVMGWDVNGPLKIGIAENVQTRLAGAQTNCPWYMKLYFQRSGPRPKIRAIEAALRKTFASKRLRGEWFDITLADACAEIEGATICRR